MVTRPGDPFLSISFRIAKSISFSSFFFPFISFDVGSPISIWGYNPKVWGYNPKVWGYNPKMEKKDRKLLKNVRILAIFFFKAPGFQIIPQISGTILTPTKKDGGTKVCGTIVPTSFYNHADKGIL